MTTIRKSITINAPVDQVFSYLTDPEHLPEIWPSMVEVTNAKHTPDGTQSFDWVYKMAGMRFRGHSDTIQAKKNQDVVVRAEKGIPSTFKWHYEGKGNQTQLSVEVDYTLPNVLLDKLAQPFLNKLNEHEAEILLNNLKARMEVGST